MALVNENFLKLPVSYLFTDIARKVNAFRVTNPDADIIRLGIGDVTQPLAPAVIAALHKATDEMASEKTFRGYGPEHGYEFLREAIIRRESGVFFICSTTFFIWSIGSPLCPGHERH